MNLCARMLLLGLVCPVFLSIPFARPLRGESEILSVPADFSPYDPCLGPRTGFVKKKDLWVVFADRDGVPVYKDMPCERAKSARHNLKYLDMFFVLEADSVSHRSLLLGRSKSSPYDEVIKIDEKIGWVRVEDLIISPEAIRNPDTFIPVKSFIINDWRFFETGVSAEDFRELKVKVRSAPRPDAEVLQTISGIEMFSYIFKYDHCRGGAGDHDWFLIGKKNLFWYDQPGQTLIGWVPASRTAEWGSRLAFEPDPERRTPANIFSEESDLLNSAHWSKEERDQRARLIDNMVTERAAPTVWRSVALTPGTTGEERVARIGFMGPVIVQGRGAVTDASFREKMMEMRDTFTHVNIIFVMDGTVSMEPYILQAASVADALMKNIRAEGMKFRFGAVVYRDMVEAEHLRFSQTELTPDIEDVTRFLRDQVKVKGLHDTDYPEALFGGFERALADLAKRGQSNILIVVADAGNQDEKGPLRRERLLQLCRDKYPWVYSLHIRRPAGGPAEGSAIAKYVPDMRRIYGIIDEVRNPDIENVKRQVFFPRSRGRAFTRRV